MDAAIQVPWALPPDHKERLADSGKVVSASSEEGRRLLDKYRNVLPWREGEPIVLLQKDAQVGNFCPKFAKVENMTAAYPDGSLAEIVVKQSIKSYDKNLHMQTIEGSNSRRVGNKAANIVGSDDKNIHQLFRKSSTANQGSTRSEISSAISPNVPFPLASEQKKALDDLVHVLCHAKSLGKSPGDCPSRSPKTMLKNIAALNGYKPWHVVYTTYDLRSDDGKVLEGPSLDLGGNGWMSKYAVADQLKKPECGCYRVENMRSGATTICLGQTSSPAVEVFTRNGCAFEVQRKLTEQLKKHKIKPRDNCKLMGLPWTLCLRKEDVDRVRNLELHERFHRNEASLATWCKRLQQARLIGKDSKLSLLQGLPVSADLPMFAMKTRDLKAFNQLAEMPGVKMRVPVNVGEDLHNYVTTETGPKKIELHRYEFRSTEGKVLGTHFFLTKGTRGERPESMLVYANHQRKGTPDHHNAHAGHRPFSGQPRK
eukprot:g71447.t1